MKKLLFFSVIAACSMLTQAQTTVNIISAGDTTWGALCPTPIAVNFNLYAELTGYDPAIDSADIYINFGDGSDTTYRAEIYSNPPNQYVWEYPQHVYTSGGAYSTQYIVTMPDNNADTVTVQSDVIISDTCGNINGQAFIDNNANCTYDAGTDDPLQYVTVWLKDSASGNILQWTYTDTTGNYWFDAPAGIVYEIEMSSYVSNGYTISCPASGTYYADAPASNLDFSVECLNGFDLEVNGYTAGFVPGTTTGRIYLYGWNNRCLPTSGQMKIVASDPLITYSHSYTNPPDAISGDTLIWDFSNLTQQGQWWWWGSNYENAFFYTDTTAQIGDTVCFELIITPTTGDQDVGNNSMTICAPIVSSYDPNNKVVSPIGKGPNGNIQPDQRMTYTINFQNTGTAPAMNIFLLDTLDVTVLDFQSLQVISTSHQLTGTKILDGNVVKFNFDDINLPDSGSNEPESNGWITYVINQVPNLTHGTQIMNQAGIYFDWNPVVETNWTVNTIDTGSAQVHVQSAVMEEQIARVFPNPANDQLYISLAEDANAEYRLFDMSGKLLQTEQFSGNLQAVNVSNYDNGFYILIIHINDKIQHQKVVITR